MRFPVLVPGQVINETVLRTMGATVLRTMGATVLRTMGATVLRTMGALDTREIPGYRPDTGYRVFTESAVKEMTA
ncbi:hypothetical protein ACIHCX_36615 [Streptomyces sp. NPDC052043]|uniref:hypothetical protein n=1 Tax=Streptomyces sp. NPDC052043 TaxID=3365684 RepID=UPI0037D23447